jgi:uncharacterized protein YrrD
MLEELKVGTSVFTSDGDEIGAINRFILDPETNEVTHIVIQKGGLFSEDKVVPFDKVRSGPEEGLVLDEEIQDYEQLPPFEETHYVEVGDRDREPGKPEDYPTYVHGPAYYWYPPYGYLGYPAYGLGLYGWPMALTQRNIPADTVPLKEGTDVISSDGEHVGDVERLLIDDDSKRVTHFVISQGLFFKEHKLVPANWVRTVKEDKVELNVSSQLLEGLPGFEDG